MDCLYNVANDLHLLNCSDRLPDALHFSVFFAYQVLQQTSDQEMMLYSDVKEHAHPVAQVMILSLSSQPVDSDDRRTEAAGDAG